MNPSNNLFGNLNTEGVETAKDVLGGQFGAIDAAVYPATLKLVYAGQSDGGARFLDFTFGVVVNGQPRDYNERVYVTNRQGQPFYEKDGKKNPLPGYTTANDLALLSTGKDLSAQNFEERIIKLYDRTAQAEVPTKVMVAVDMLGKQVKIGVLKALENKTKKNDSTGTYEPFLDDNGQVATRETNTIDKVFHADRNFTVSEYLRHNAGTLDTAEFIDQWSKKNEGTVRNKVKPVDGKAGAPGTGGAMPTGTTGAAASPKSLFGG